MAAGKTTLSEALECVLADVQHWRLPPVACVRALISKILGYMLVVGGAVVKLPQVIAVWKARSSAGLSSTAYELETFGYCIGVFYALGQPIPFSAYGETVFIFFENLLLLALIYRFSTSPLGVETYAKATGLAALTGALGLKLIPYRFVEYLFNFSHLIFLNARIPQIVLNFKNRSTGRLSPTTTFLMMAGACARCFTTVQEGGSSSMLVGSSLGVILHLILLTQIIMYYKNTQQQNAIASGSGPPKLQKAE